MTATTLHIETARAVWGRELAASLPASVRRTDAAGEIVLIDGDGDWPARLSRWIEQGTRRIVLADPDAPAARRIDPLIALVRQTGTRIMLAETHAGNPAVAPFSNALAADMTIVTLTGHGTRSLADLALEQLRLARAAGFGDFAPVHRLVTQGHLLAIFDASRKGQPVLLRLTVSVSDAGLGHHRLMAHAPAASGALCVYNGTSARPADAVQINALGSQIQPTVYESAHRAVLRAVLADPSAPTGDLTLWQSDAMLALEMVEGG